MRRGVFVARLKTSGCARGGARGGARGSARGSSSNMQQTLTTAMVVLPPQPKDVIVFLVLFYSRRHGLNQSLQRGFWRNKRFAVLFSFSPPTGTSAAGHAAGHATGGTAGVGR